MSPTIPIYPDYGPPKVKNLGLGTRRILRAMAPIVLPRNATLNVDCDEEIVNYVDNYVMYLPPLFRLAFPLGVWLFELAAILWSGRFVPYTFLTLDRKQAYLAGWSHSKYWWRRDLLKGIKGLMMMGYFEHPEVMKKIQYDQGEQVATVKARRLATYAQEI